MKKNRLCTRRALSLLLALAMLLGTVPVVTPRVHAVEFDWEWTDESGVAEATCSACGTTYQVTECESSADAEDKLSDYFCDDCGLCGGEGNDECWSRHHCELCGGCCDDADMCDGCMENDLFAHEDCVAEIDDTGVHCPFCKGHFGAGVMECVCEYAMVTPHCTDCHEESCENCGICLVLFGSETEALENGGCAEHSLCVCCIQDDPNHCKECHTCDSEICAECGYCEDHAQNHCRECGTCFGEEEMEMCPDDGEHCVFCCEENGWLCPECEHCTEALGLEICEECGLCEDCCYSACEAEGCSHGYCIASADYEEHLCPGCGVCPDDTECEYCGLCESCQEDYHCEHGLCPDDFDFDDHVCQGCGNCFEMDELCEFCRMCESCREDYHCRHGVCPDDPTADDGHGFCAQCGDCFDARDLCPDCGLCKSCCAENTAAMGCGHGYCIASKAFRDHWCYADEQCADKCSHDALCAHAHVSTAWSKNGTAHWHICEDCGASVDEAAHTPGAPVTVVAPDPLTRKNGTDRISCTVCGEVMETITVPYVEVPKDGKPYIISQPKDIEAKVSDVTTENVARYVTFKVYAGGEGLSYQWYEYRKNRRPDEVVTLKDGGEVYSVYSGKPDVTGATAATLTVAVPCDGCYEDYQYYCVIANASGSVTTRRAKLNAQHVYGLYQNNQDGTHTNWCVGDGCDAVKGKPESHRYGEWVLKQAATATQQGIKEQKCMDCGDVHRRWLPTVDPDHVHQFTKIVRSPTKHWYECACGLKGDAPMEDHIWGAPEITVQPTEKKIGEQKYKCTVCGFARKETVPRLPHTHDYYNGFELGYREPGKAYYSPEQHYVYCKSGDGQIKAEKHTYESWRILSGASSSYSGVMERQCIYCPYTQYKYYRYGTYPVMVEGGTPNPDVAAPGTRVTVTWDQYADYRWDGGTYWKDMSSEGVGLEAVALSPSANAATVTFTMPNGPVGLEAYGISSCDHSRGTVKGERVEPTCLGYGHEPDTICKDCGKVLAEGERIEPPGHDLPDKPIPGTERVEYCTLTTPRNDGGIGSIANTATGGYSGDFACKRCHKTVKGKKTPLKHGRHDKAMLYIGGPGGPGRTWEGPEYLTVENYVEPTCTKDGYTGDERCDWCHEIAYRGEKEDRTGHSWGEWEVVRQATTRVKGMEKRVCEWDSEHVQTRVTDYTGPDYRVRPDKKKLHFDFTYGEQPEPQTVSFTSVGRDEVYSVTWVDAVNFGNTTKQTLSGMTMTVEAVPWAMVDALADDSEYLRVYAVDGMELPEADQVDIEVTANIRKTTEKYDLTVEGGKACIGEIDRRTAKASLRVPGGEYMHLLADDPDSFLRWEVEDASGYIQSFWTVWRENEEPEAFFYMSANPVKVKALTKNTPNVHQILFDPNAGDVTYMSFSKYYTNSKGEIDLLPACYRKKAVLEGWYTQPDGGKLVQVGEKLTQDTTLYAHWKEQIPGRYTITFDPNGGKVDTPSALTVDGKLSSMPRATHPHLYFNGWYTAPQGGSYCSELDTFTEDMVLYAHWEYGLEIAGVKVTKENQDDILGNGRFSFDGVGTLTVKGSYRTEKNANLIHNFGFKELVINIAKDATLICKQDYDPIHLEADTTITGPGTLTVTGGTTGIYMNSPTGTLTLKDVNVEAANQWGIAGPNGGNSARLILDNAGIKAGCVTAAICDFGGGITMHDCQILLPKDGKISDDGSDVVDADGREAPTVIIEAGSPIKRFDLEVDGVRVTELNRKNILGNGIFSFDGDRTLTILGSYSSAGQLICNTGVDKLIIEVVKDSTLTSGPDHEVINAQADTTVTGTGRLTLAGGAGGVFVQGGNATLTIKNVTMAVEGRRGIGGPNGGNKTRLIVDNADLEINSENGAICDFGGGVKIRNSRIVEPEGGRISDEKTDVVDAGGEIANRVKLVRTNPFVDVQDRAYFYFNAVRWAVSCDPQITNGIDATHFGPDLTCTRGQVVTFLWRAAGCPEPASMTNPFADVKTGAFYFKAVLWAVEQGITKGMDATHFGPDQACTRGQVVTFLWRAAGATEPVNRTNPFVDVKPEAFYGDAVLWAAENNVTKGTDETHFSPGRTCTRGQIVTFLHRAEQAGAKGLLLYVKDVDRAEDGGLVLKGVIQNGQVYVGDEIKVYSTGSSGKTKEVLFTVQAIKRYPEYGEALDRASATDLVDLFIGATSETISVGDTVVNAAGPFVPTDMVVGSLYMVEGGDPLNNGDKIPFKCDISGGFDVIAELGGVRVAGGLQPGHTYYDVVFDKLSSPVVVFRGQSFMIYKDGKRMANYTIDENQ